MLQEKVKQVFESNNGTISLRFAKAHGLDKETLRKAYLRGEIEKPYRGIYTLPDQIEDDFWAIQEMYPKGIYSLETALYFHRLTSFAPFRYYMTFPRGYSNPNLKKNLVVPTWVEQKFWDVGITKAETLVGNQIRVYDLERTMVDILSSKRVHPGLVLEATEEYLSRSDTDHERLVAYCKMLKRPHVLERWESLHAEIG